MNTQQIINKLENAGFEVNVSYPFVIVGLTNRTISKMEVWTALNFQGNMDAWMSCNDGTVWIKC